MSISDVCITLHIPTVIMVRRESQSLFYAKRRREEQNMDIKGNLKFIQNNLVRKEEREEFEVTKIQFSQIIVYNIILQQLLRLKCILSQACRSMPVIQEVSIEGAGVRGQLWLMSWLIRP